MPATPVISLVVPAYNEEESIGEFVAQACRALDDHGQPYELICVDDGSSDRTVGILDGLRTRHSGLRVVSLRRNCGISLFEQPGSLGQILDQGSGGIVAVRGVDSGFSV
jgi:glycosyltransferase involved in cell wall biosynthesis